MKDRRQSDRLLRIVAGIAVAGAIAGFSNLGYSYFIMKKVVGIETKAETEAKEREERRAVIEKWRQEMRASSQIRDDEISKLKSDVAKMVAAKKR